MNPNKMAAAPTPDAAATTVESLSHDGRGVAHVGGKAVFIEGALPGEEVRFRYLNRRRRYDNGAALEILSPGPDRVPPPCPHFGACGGCSLQHLRPEAQIRAKQQALAEQLRGIGKVQPESWLAPVTGPAWGYRRRARLGARFVPKNGGVLVGFRARRRSFIANLDACPVLEPRISGLLPQLRALVAALSCPDRIPQIEVAVGADAAALVFRHLVPLADRDLELLRAFGARHTVQIHLQGGGPESVRALWPDEAPALFYRLPEHDIKIYFRPTDFIQINDQVNRRAVAQAIALLDPGPRDTALDLFCGLGNFTLPLARRVQGVLGIEAEPGLVEGARRNAAANGVANAEFRAANLYDAVSAAPPWGDLRFDKLLLDPPRSGAIEAIKLLPSPGPERIVYISCYPVTLARDSEYLVHARGYRLAAAGVMDMFPHTSHVESMAMFVRE